MRKIFVSGGAGFIGSTFIRMILAETTDTEITNTEKRVVANRSLPIKRLQSIVAD
jgi:dTDP-D-glucose 4,6-dehydratase